MRGGGKDKDFCPQSQEIRKVLNLVYLDGIIFLLFDHPLNMRRVEGHSRLSAVSVFVAKQETCED